MASASHLHPAIDGKRDCMITEGILIEKRKVKITNTKTQTSYSITNTILSNLAIVSLLDHCCGAVGYTRHMTVYKRKSNDGGFYLLLIHVHTELW
jgi:hypothetical protein